MNLGKKHSGVWLLPNFTLFVLLLLSLYLFNNSDNNNNNNHNKIFVNATKSTTKPYTTFHHFNYCYSDDEEDQYDTDLNNNSFTTIHNASLTIIPTIYSQPGILGNINLHFNKNITNINQYFYRIEMWHEQSGKTIKYKGPYDICCGTFLTFLNNNKNNIKNITIDINSQQQQQTTSLQQQNNTLQNETLQQQNKHLEYNCDLSTSICPIIINNNNTTTINIENTNNIENIYNIQFSRPLYLSENGTYEITLKIYHLKPIFSNSNEENKSIPIRNEMIDDLCIIFPIQLYFNENLNNLLWKVNDEQLQVSTTVVMNNITITNTTTNTTIDNFTTKNTTTNSTTVQ